MTRICLLLLLAFLPIAANAQYIQGSGAGPSSGINSELAFPFIGSQTTGSVIISIPCTVQYNFPANFLGTKASCGSSPAATRGYLIKVNATEIGAVCLSSSCTTTGDSGLLLCTGSACSATCTGGTGLPQTCAVGQRLEIDQPATSDGSDISIGLAYTR